MSDKTMGTGTKVLIVAAVGVGAYGLYTLVIKPKIAARRAEVMIGGRPYYQAGPGYYHAAPQAQNPQTPFNVDSADVIGGSARGAPSRPQL